ncbi:alpha-L-fucosidase [bacterium]|nr:alpha-L-fucosidase [bacterium]
MQPAPLFSPSSEPFEPEWSSLLRYQVPTWYEDAKFGIFIHWGVYSVPAFKSEWYPRMMYQQGSDEFAHHVATYGSHTEFGYKDFIPSFTGEYFNAAEWARLFQRSGARYVMPVAEHHDGFALYDSSFTRWKSTTMGPKRDVIAELAEAIRAEGMVFSLSSHRAENWFYFNGGRAFDSDVQNPAFADLYGAAAPLTEHGIIPGEHGHDRLSEPYPDASFLEGWLGRSCELVDKYRPQIVWFDWWVHHVAFEPYLRRFSAYYYNRGREWGLGVAINYKYNAFPEGSAVFDVERGQLDGIRPLFWQTDTAVSNSSWGYTKDQDYKTVPALIADLVDIVSKNGSLLLNVGPRADGIIPKEDEEILLGIGAWLKINGEAIYGTRPWKIYGEGPTSIPAGAHTDKKRPAFTGEDIRFTTQRDVLYATVLGPLKDRLVRIASLSGKAVTSIELLGSNYTPTCEQKEGLLEIRIPDEVTPQAGLVFKFKLIK